MSVEANKALIRRVSEEVLNRRSVAAVYEGDLLATRGRGKSWVL